MRKLWCTAAVLVVGMAGASVSRGQAQAQGAIPDSPRPQTLPGAADVTPGKGTASSTSDGAINPDGSNAVPSALPKTPAAEQPLATGDPEPDIKPELGEGGRVKTIRVPVNFVQIPFTVKDNKGQLVPALTWRDVQVFENGTRKQLRLFTVDPYPLSVAFVLDQSLPYQTMNSVNIALGAVQGAFTPYDELALFTYNNGPKQRSEYSKADGAHVAAIMERSKSTGREDAPMMGGPLSQNVNLNNGALANTMPNVDTNHGLRSDANVENLPKETHTLNDAVFAAAESLSKRPDGRRRIIYVVSDGREAGSKIKFKDVIRYLQTNNITVYATVVGTSATPYVGFLDKYHIPFTMKENILPQYVQATGGEAISEFRVRGIEQSFSRIAEDVRVKYTAGYYSNESVLDSKFRTWEVQVMRPGLNVIAPRGYFPSPKAVLRPGSSVVPTTAQ